MTEHLRVLILEDNPSDAELMAAGLRRAGYALECLHVETEKDFLRALDWGPDVILADYHLPAFDGLGALAHVNRRGMDVPFLLVSANIGEEAAVAALHQGASDYLLKDRLTRLGSAVEQALERRRLRRQASQAQASLEESRAWMAGLLDSAMDAIIAVDESRRVAFFNPAAARTFRVDAGAAKGQPADRFLPADFLTRAATEPAGRLLTVHPVRARRGDGEEFSAEASVSEMEAGGKKFHTVILRDVTEREKLEEQFRQAQKMEVFGRLAGGVAHDFNNLLTVICGFSEVLLDSLPRGNSQRDLVRQIKDAGERASALTMQLLAFSRKQVVQPAVLDLNAHLADMAKMLRRLIGENIDLAFVPAPGLWPVKVDPGHLTQVVMNLGVNARDAMPEGGKLIIETANVDLDQGYSAGHVQANRGPHVRLTVSDSGCGMDEATRKQIFEPFFTTKKPDRGTGLGLATVFGIVHQAGGHIEVYSEPGMGACFKVYLPRTEEPAPSSRPSSRMMARPAATETVLIVEDDEGPRSLARTVLGMSGYSVLEAQDGEDALRVSRAHPGEVHLLLTDAVLPGINGRQVAERLRVDRPGLRVLFMSGYTEDMVLHHSIVERHAAFLHKPFGMAELSRRVREVLDDVRQEPAGIRVTSPTTSPPDQVP